MTDGELDDPAWRLEPAELPGLGTLLRRLPAMARPVAATVWSAAPRALLQVVVLQLGAGAATTFGLLSTTRVLAELLAAGPTPDRVVAAVPALLAVAAAYLVRGLLESGVLLAEARAVPAVVRAAEERLLAAALAVDLEAYEDHRFYDRLHRARDRGLLHLERAVGTVVELAGGGLALVAAAVGVAVLHPVLLPVLLLGALPQGWAVLRSARIGYAGVNRTISLLRRVWMIADLASDREPAAGIRADQAGPMVLGEYRRLADAVRDEQVRVGVAQARTAAAGRAAAGCGLAVTIVVLGLLLDAGWLPLAVAGTATIAVQTAAAALTRLVMAANQLVEHVLYVGDYQDFLTEAARRTTPAGGRPAPAAPFTITLDGVGFGYPGAAGRPALDGITLTIGAGETVALVGENGSGKTTLAKLLAGLYRPDTGTIRWDGVDLAGVDPAAAAARVAVVLQDPVRWPHDARTNVRAGRHDRPDPDGAALRAAAAAARADEVVAGLPRGWDTLLSRYFRDGRELSGGQWQRLAVARGLFRDAPVMICDEPTAPLDAKAERDVVEALRAAARGRTLVLVTHRLASVRHADRIVVLRAGRLVEQGTHDELMAAGGRYAELFTIQSQLYGPDPVPSG